jgi:aminoglycoside phosphotransferase (APT) family kinase protein
MLSRADFDLVRRDGSLPGLELLLDRDAFAGALHATLPAAGITAAEPTYLRYKPRTSCLAGYRLTVSGRAVEVHARAYLPADSERMYGLLARSGTPSVIGPGHILLEEIAVVVSVFPNDGELEALSLLADAAGRHRLLQKMLPEWPRLWEGTLQSLRYKPERRYVGQLLTREGMPAAVLKLYSEEDFPAAQANAKAFEACSLPLVARRLGRSSRHRLVALEWVPGRVLTEVLTDPSQGLEALHASGEALAGLHSQRPKRLARLDRAGEAAMLRNIAADLGAIMPSVAERADAVAGRLATCLEQAHQGHVPIHGDFYAKQVVLTEGGTAAILDLDQAVWGDPAADLGSFVAHMERDALGCTVPIYPMASLRDLASLRDSFLTGYREKLHLPDSDWLGLHTAVGLFRLSPEPFRRREPDWPARTEAIVTRSEEILNGSLPSMSGWPRHPRHRGVTEYHALNVAVVDPFCAATSPDMPYLAGATDPPQAWHQLRHHLPMLFASQAQVRLHSIRVTRYKPGRRCLLEYDLERERPGQRPEPLTLVGKVRARGLDRSTYQLQQLLWNAVFSDSSEDHISVPEPVGVIPEFQMWLQRKVPGAGATRLMPGPEGNALSRRIAEAIHKLHEAGALTRRRHTIGDELRILHERLPTVALMRPEWAGRIERLLDGCDRLGAGLPQPEFRGIHRDFYADQVIVDESRLYLLDLDLYCEGDPALDVGNFLGHMTEQALRTLDDPDALADREEALEERFVQLSGKRIRPSIQAYKTLTLVRHIHLSTQITGRGRCTEPLLELCEQRLGVA